MQTMVNPQTDLFKSNVDFMNLEIRPGQFGFTKSVWKSVFQKNVRRNRIEASVRTAVAYMEVDLIDFIRRLAIVIIEDVILHPKYDKLVALMIKAGRKGYIPTEKDLNMLVHISEDIARVEWRDYEALFNDIKGKPIWDDKYLKGLTDREQSIVKSLMVRAKYGGMKCDMDTLNEMAIIWAKRFKNDKDFLSRLKSIYDFGAMSSASDERMFKTFEDVGLARKKDFLLEGVDFHMSPIVKILLKKKEFLDDCKKADLQTYYKDDNEEIAKEIIWRFRSSINYKKDIFTKKPFGAVENQPESEVKKLRILFDKWLPEIDALSKWWLRTLLKENK
jgi:hypothetical protein